ncbi:glycosyltransferase family 4 protein [Marinobacter sp. F4218]|uniref:glycosyltransferase family 4 protein n=1 Tax=Marinobacter sp. F4218 TaxID=2862868 RepID=UPI001C62D764|nr:glycosyltransferase family 4 protein [Marinobacter sp. F4218]MBW7470093.1 glycosyltransferase family 4 protein [Marinobacter sp. F4218]
MARSESPWDIEFVVPGDPNQNTGGYCYVRLLVEALKQLGLTAEVTGVPGRFPWPDAEAKAALDRCLRGFHDGAVVVLDGLAMGGLPEVVEAHASRLTLTALVHHPLADETGLSAEEQRWFLTQERRALAAVGRVITTSGFTADRLVDFGVQAQNIRTVEPGVQSIPGSSTPDPSVRVSGDAPRILCVAHLSPRKAQHQLIEALAGLRSLPWFCTLAGSCDRNPDYSERVRTQIKSAGLESRVSLTGEVNEDRLFDLYRQADLFVFPSLYEGYGMVIDEALAAGLPVITSNGGALAQTARRRGVVQYEAGDVGSLSATLGGWLADPQELARQKDSARQESAHTRNWRLAAIDFQEAMVDLVGTRQQSLFDREWLRRREGSDHAARSERLTLDLARWVRTAYPAHPQRNGPGAGVSIVDLGAGRGSNALYLIPRLLVPQRWLLLDQDAGLLDEAQERLTAPDVEVSQSVVRLGEDSLGRHIPAEVGLVTASALIDLVSENWLKALVKAVVTRQSALLVVLSYAGRFELDPPHEHDDRLRALVNRHQHRDKGVGRALGAEATRVLKDLMEDSGYTVSVADSPWCLEPGNASLTGRLLEGWVQAADEQDPCGAEWLSDWLATRETQLAAGTLSVTVHHLDLLALPGEA